jgi:hypothetical protein
MASRGKSHVPCGANYPHTARDELRPIELEPDWLRCFQLPTCRTQVPEATEMLRSDKAEANSQGSTMSWLGYYGYQARLVCV